jgi:hypothetical protein
MWLDRWRAVLDAGIESVLDVLTSSTPHAIELRQNSPFAGVLPKRSAWRSWRRSPTAGAESARHEA